MVALKETIGLVQELIRENCKKQAIDPGQLTIYADRGSPMIANTMAQLFVTLGINQFHNRPHVSDDNPYSETQFKALKYCRGFFRIDLVPCRTLRHLARSSLPGKTPSTGIVGSACWLQKLCIMGLEDM